MRAKAAPCRPWTHHSIDHPKQGGDGQDANKRLRPLPPLHSHRHAAPSPKARSTKMPTTGGCHPLFQVALLSLLSLCTPLSPCQAKVPSQSLPHCQSHHCHRRSCHRRSCHRQLALPKSRRRAMYIITRALSASLGGSMACSAKGGCHGHSICRRALARLRRCRTAARSSTCADLCPILIHDRLFHGRLDRVSQIKVKSLTRAQPRAH